MRIRAWFARLNRIMQIQRDIDEQRDYIARLEPLFDRAVKSAHGFDNQEVRMKRDALLSAEARIKELESELAEL